MIIKIKYNKNQQKPPNKFKKRKVQKASRRNIYAMFHPLTGQKMDLFYINKSTDFSLTMTNYTVTCR